MDKSYPARFALTSALLVAALVMAFVPAMAAPELEGRWRLVEQYYGKGTSNIANTEVPLRLQFFKEGASQRGRLWAGDDVESPAGSSSGAVEIDRAQSVCK